MSPWTDIPDFNVGQVLTASRMNEVRDNGNIGHVVCTSATRPGSPDTGTMIYETDTGKAYLWDGGNWIVLNIGDPQQFRFFVANEVGSTVSATNKATFNFVPVNEGSCWSSVNHRFTAPVNGSYYFHISLLNSAASAFYAEFRKNGSAMGIGSYPRGYSGTQYIANTAGGIIPLNANDYIEVWITGGTMHSYHCFLTGWLLSAVW